MEEIQKTRTIAEPGFVEHLTVFVDFIGTSEAAGGWGEAALSDLTQLLLAVAQLKGDFVMNVEDKGETKLSTFRPQITTFSDHIVLSYPVSELAKAVVDSGAKSDIHILTALQQVEGIIAQLAADAMRLGLMIRGGAAIGPLYHSGGAVLGKAMVEAYELESKVAVYPRIAVSGSIQAALTQFPGYRIRKDDRDGIVYLDYFGSMILKSGSGPGPDMMANVKLWLDTTRQRITQNMEKFAAESAWNKYAKWAWFRNELERALKGINPGLLSEGVKVPTQGVPPSADQLLA